MSDGPNEQGPPPRRARRPFWLKLTLMGAILVVLPMLVVGPMILGRGTSVLETLSRDLRIAVAQDVARTLDDELARAEDDLDGIGRLLTDESVDEESALAMAMQLLGASSVLDHAVIYDQDGRALDAMREPGGEALSVESALSADLRRRATQDGVALDEPLLDGDASFVTVVIPLRADGRVTGYVASAVPLEAVQRRLAEIADGQLRDDPDGLFVVDDTLHIIVHPDPAVVRERPSLAGRGIFEGADAATLAAGARFTAEYEHDGRPMVGSVVPAAGGSWAVVAQVPRDVAYGPVITVRRVLLGTTLVAVILAFLVAVMLARRISRPIQELSAFAVDLAERRFDKRVTVYTSDELSLLGDAMSAAAADLEESDKRIREEVAIRSDLGRYLPAELVGRVVNREQDMGLGGVRREISVVFADVVAFTPLTDQLSAEDVVTILNELFTIMTEIVFRHEGTVDKFVGDCVMAIWGAPRAQEDHAARALLAAEEMQQWLEAGNAGWRERFGVTIELAIGIHSGEAIVGNIGSETRMEYTAIGDVVNVAARLEAIARPQQILVTEATREAVGDDFDFEDRGPRTLVGRKEPVHLFEVKW